MSFLLWLLPTLLYIVGYLLALWRIAGQLAWHFYEGGRRAWLSKRGNIVPDSEQWGAALFLGAIFALVWPLSLPLAYGMAQAQTDRGRSLFEELEREAGIR